MAQEQRNVFAMEIDFIYYFLSHLSTAKEGVYMDQIRAFATSINAVERTQEGRDDMLNMFVCFVSDAEDAARERFVRDIWAHVAEDMDIETVSKGIERMQASERHNQDIAALANALVQGIQSIAPHTQHPASGNRSGTGERKKQEGSSEEQRMSASQPQSNRPTKSVASASAPAPARTRHDPTMGSAAQDEQDDDEFLADLRHNYGAILASVRRLHQDSEARYRQIFNAIRNQGPGPTPPPSNGQTAVYNTPWIAQFYYPANVVIGGTDGGSPGGGENSRDGGGERSRGVPSFIQVNGVNPRRNAAQSNAQSGGPSQASTNAVPQQRNEQARQRRDQAENAQTSKLNSSQQPFCSRPTASGFPASASHPSASQALLPDVAAERMLRIHIAATHPNVRIAPVTAQRLLEVQNAVRALPGWNGNWPQVVMPGEQNENWTHGFTLGFDRPLPGRSGNWHFFRTGEAEGSDELAAREQLGDDPEYFPGNLAPDADEVNAMRRHQRDERNVSYGLTDNIVIVWVPYHMRTQTAEAQRLAWVPPAFGPVTQQHQTQTQGEGETQSPDITPTTPSSPSETQGQNEGLDSSAFDPLIQQFLTQTPREGQMQSPNITPAPSTDLSQIEDQNEGPNSPVADEQPESSKDAPEQVLFPSNQDTGSQRDLDWSSQHDDESEEEESSAAPPAPGIPPMPSQKPRDDQYWHFFPGDGWYLVEKRAPGPAPDSMASLVKEAQEQALKPGPGVRRMRKSSTAPSTTDTDVSGKGGRSRDGNTSTTKRLRNGKAGDSALKTVVEEEEKSDEELDQADSAKTKKGRKRKRGPKGDDTEEPARKRPREDDDDDEYGGGGTGAVQG